MSRGSLRSSVATLALAAFVAAGIGAAPLELTDDFGVKAKVAEAKGGKGGNDNGGRGGNDKGNKGGNGHGKGGNSSSAGISDALLEEDETEDIEVANKGSYGSLNASNASATAREHASQNSRVGAIADYENALTGDVPDPDAAAAALARAANKEITPDAVGMVNGNIGVVATPEEEAEEMAALAEEARTNPAVEDEPEEEEMSSEETEGEGTPEEETDEIASATEELLDDEEETSTE